MAFPCCLISSTYVVIIPADSFPTSLFSRLGRGQWWLIAAIGDMGHCAITVEAIIPPLLLLDHAIAIVGAEDAVGGRPPSNDLRTRVG